MRAFPHGANSIAVLGSGCVRSGDGWHCHSPGFTILVLLTAGLCGCNSLSGNLNNQVGMWNYERGNYPAARGEFSRAVADDPLNPAFHYNLACTAQRLGDSAGATQAYWRAIQLDSSHEPSYHALARLLVEEGRRDEATELISNWVEAQPRSAGAHIEMAWIERENGDLNAAEQSLFRSLAARPNNPIATGQLGELYERMGHSERAAIMYRRSLQADWFQPQIQARLALLESHRGPIEVPNSQYAFNSGVPSLTANSPGLASPSVQVPTTAAPSLARAQINDDPAHLVD